jgi:hypothetical protein
VAVETNVILHKAAIFRHINTGNPCAHHDALEFPDGQIVLLGLMQPGQRAIVLQLSVNAVVLKEPVSSPSEISNPRATTHN